MPSVTETLRILSLNCAFKKLRSTDCSAKTKQHVNKHHIKLKLFFMGLVKNLQVDLIENAKHPLNDLPPQKIVVYN